MTRPRPPRLDDPAQARELFELALDGSYLNTATALLVCCDAESRAIGHVHVLDCAADPTVSSLTEAIDAVLERVAGFDGPDVGGLALGLTRPGDERVGAYDRAWFRALYRVGHRRRLTVHGVYLVTRRGVRQVTMDDAA